MEFQVGIDEAGRGPVIGPMVYACTAWPISKSMEYSKLGFTDSKQINRDKREQLFSIISTLQNTYYKTIQLSSEYISNQMLAIRPVNLNEISMQSAQNLIIQLLQQGLNVKYVYVDTVGRPESYEKRLSQRFQGINFTVRAKADSLFSIVSAASICAKVRRDWCIDQIKAQVGDVGCGYPSDPITRNWMQTNFDPVFGYDSKFVRVSWATCKTFTSSIPKVAWPEDNHKLDFTQSKNFYLHQILKLS